MNPINKFGAFSSSVNGNVLGKTIEGAIIGASTFIIYLAHRYGLEIGTEQITELAISIGSIISTGFVLFGLIRKVVVFFTTPRGEDVTPPIVQVAPENSLPPVENK